MLPEGIAILGGTFDPVHIGHLRSAVELGEALGVKQVRLIPSYQPPHRHDPGSKPTDRLAMLRLAAEGNDLFAVDDREITREGKSFTIDTLKSIREELGDEVPLSMALGYDAFLLLDQWRDWKLLTDYAHLVVMARPGSEEEGPGDELTNFFSQKFVDDPLCLHSKPHGMICRLEMTQLAISASQVREIFKSGRSADYIVPGEVIRYVRDHGLYRTASL